MSESSASGGAPEVLLGGVPFVHPDTALQRVAGRWMAATADDHLHTFEDADGSVSEVAERIIELVDGVRTVGKIVETLMEEFEVPRAVCEADTRSFVGLLVNKQVLALK